MRLEWAWAARIQALLTDDDIRGNTDDGAVRGMRRTATLARASMLLRRQNISVVATSIT